MKQISSLMTRIPQVQNRDNNITNERQLILRDFLDRLNLDRKPPYKPLQAPRLGKMMMYMSTQEMKEFYAVCKEAGSFSKYFWYSFKQ
jgi:hypothetical protein